MLAYMYGLAYSLIPYFIPSCGSAFYIVGSTFPVAFLSDVFLVASILASMSVCPPRLEYLEIKQMMSLPKDPSVHLSLQEISWEKAAFRLTG